MIRHIVFFNFKEGATELERAEVIDGLKGLKDSIDVVKELEVGVDPSGGETSYDLALNTLFDSHDDLKIYAEHPKHLEVVVIVNKYCAGRVKVDYSI